MSWPFGRRSVKGFSSLEVEPLDLMADFVALDWDLASLVEGLISDWEVDLEASDLELEDFTGVDFCEPWGECGAEEDEPEAELVDGV